MSFEYKILGSSSSGNCSFLKTEKSKILIDAGFSAKKITQLLEDVGESANELDAVFLTHEHADHADGIRGLTRNHNIRVFANKDTAFAVQQKLKKQANWQIFETGQSFTFQDLAISPFSIPHDAYDPVAFVFKWGKEGDIISPKHSLAWVTDLGYASNLVKDKIKNVDTLIIEANYDENLLENDSKRPWSVKQRIRGRHGHLSNETSLETLLSIDNPNWKRIYLAHLSKDCNHINKVEKVFSPFIERYKHIDLDIINPLGGIHPLNSTCVAV